MADLRSTRVFGELTVMHNATVQGNLTVAGILEAASITGKASSADVLATARTLKIGNSSKTFNGSANVAWTLAEIGAAAATTSIVAGTGLTGGGTLDANRTLNVAYGTTANTAAQGNDSRINNGQTAFSWGNHASAGYVKTNTTYSEITEAEINTGTAATLRTISARRLLYAISTHGLQIGTTASTAKAGNWTPAVADIPNLPASKITSGTFAAARIPTLNQNTTGNAATATRLQTARTISLGGSLEGSASFNGSSNITINSAIARATITGDPTSTFRADIFGSNQYGIRLIRGITGGGPFANYSPGLAWSTSDTHGFLTLDYNNASAKVGAGSGAGLSWSKALVFDDDTRIVNATPNTRTITAGTGLSGGGNLTANRTLSVKYGTAAGTAAQGNDSRINNGQTAYGWGNHASAGYVKTDTKYTAGNGLTLSGTAFSLPVTVSGTGTFVSSVTQTAGGITVTLGTPPNTNTTYSEIPEAEVTAGTASTARSISGRRLKLAVDTHGLKIGTTASTAKAGDWTPAAGDIPNLPASKITSGTFAAARIPTLNQNTTGSAATLTTARTLTIGSTGKTFNGSANVAWTLAEIGAADRARTITAGTGLSGGGNLTANRTISIASGASPLTAEALSDRDLDTVQTPGYYYQSTNANANANRHYPLGDSGVAGTLVVTTAAGVVQEYTTYGPNNRKFTRGMYSDTWSEWKEVGAGGASSWSELTGKPSTFPPSTHTHTIAQVSGLQSAIDAKVNVSGNQTISGTKDFSGVLRATGTANATSATSGSLRSSGGLGVASNIFAGGNITAYSDVRRKKDIVTIDGALDIILKARGVYYTRKDTGAKEVGFIAQEMQKILPRVVGGTEETGLGISYGNITAVLAEAVKTVYNDHVTPAKERISQLEDQNQKLIERLERLEALVSNKLLNEE